MIVLSLYILALLVISIHGFSFPSRSRLRKSTIKMNFEDLFVKFIDDDRKWKAEFIDDDRKWKAEQNLKTTEMLATVKKIDIIYENIVRQNLVQSKGSNFGRSYKITNLWGLARVALPKEKRLSQSLSGNRVLKVDSALYTTVHQERTIKLAKAAQAHLPALLKWIDENRNNTNKAISRKIRLFDSAYSAFKKIKTKAGQLQFIMDNPLGIYLLSMETLLYPNKTGFITEYETDIRGSVELREYLLSVNCGEVKTGHDRKKAIQQLIKRLSIIRCALQHLLSDNERRRIAILLIGSVYSMVDGWKSPDESEIAELAKDIGIIVEKHSICIDMETVR